MRKSARAQSIATMGFDAHVRVVVPGGQRTGLTRVQVNTLFNGTTLPSNNNVQVDIRP